MALKVNSWIIRSIAIIIIIIASASIYYIKTAQNRAEIAVRSMSNTENTSSSKAMPAMPLKVNRTDLDEIKKYGLPTAIDFGSDSCKQCKKMAPVLETLHAEWQGRGIVQFMDIRKYSQGVNDFPVTVIPTQVFFNADGTPFVPSEALASQIEFMIIPNKADGSHAFTLHQGGISEQEMRSIFKEMGVE